MADCAAGNDVLYRVICRLAGWTVGGRGLVGCWLRFIGHKTVRLRAKKNCRNGGFRMNFSLENVCKSF